MWKRLAERPGGTRLFSAAAVLRVPYFASIVPHVVRMEPGFAEVTVPKWFFVKHIRVMQLIARTRGHHDDHNHPAPYHAHAAPARDRP